MSCIKPGLQVTQEISILQGICIWSQSIGFWDTSPSEFLTFILFGLFFVRGINMKFREYFKGIGTDEYRYDIYVRIYAII